MNLKHMDKHFVIGFTILVILGVIGFCRWTNPLYFDFTVKEQKAVYVYTTDRWTGQVWMKAYQRQLVTEEVPTYNSGDFLSPGERTSAWHDRNKATGMWISAIVLVILDMLVYWWRRRKRVANFI